MIGRPNISEPPRDNPDAVALVDEILVDAIVRSASDIHIEPTAAGTEVRLRIDGLLEVHSRHDSETGRSLVARLMVMAHLLTYRLDIPQEGRLQTNVGRTPPSPSPGIPGEGRGEGQREQGRELELRLAIMPTTHGLRAAVRMPAELLQPRSLDNLGLPPNVLDGLKRFASADSGMLLVTGPAGSGKTTTIYALLEYIVQTCPGLSIIALEDPVERDIAGVTQIEVSPFGQLTYERALRSILRQDPQVLMLGEIRDVATASLAAQAALSGHRLICTLHAATPGGAIARLLEMGLESYRITSSLYGVVAQRLLRRISGPPGESNCLGRIPIAEFVGMTEQLRAAILARADAEQLQQIASKHEHHTSLRDSANSLVAQRLVDINEVQRVLGSESP